MTKFCCECMHFFKCVSQGRYVDESCYEYEYAGYVVGGDRELEKRIEAEPWPWEDLKGDFENGS